MLARHDGLETLTGVLDAVVAADPDLFLPLTEELVQVHNWYSVGPRRRRRPGVRGELWRAAFSRATREALMPLLPDSAPLADVDEDDLGAQRAPVRRGGGAGGDGRHPTRTAPAEPWSRPVDGYARRDAVVRTEPGGTVVRVHWCRRCGWRCLLGAASPGGLR